jgi:hypothetical protein
LKQICKEEIEEEGGWGLGQALLPW